MHHDRICIFPNFIGQTWFLPDTGFLNLFFQFVSRALYGKRQATGPANMTDQKMTAITTERDTLHENLHRYFGFDAFKGEQRAIIQSLLNGQDTFVIMPTGGGKSLCYQLPALMLPGTAIIISPLIALMKNQVDAIRGYSDEDEVAHFLNSSLTKAQMKKVKQDISDGKTKMLYVAPETLTKEENIEFFRSSEISFVAVDEAPCISEGGHDFRPESRRIRAMPQHAALPIMMKQKSGVILSTASGAGMNAVPGVAVYGAAKAAIISPMKNVAAEYGAYGIRANSISPGPMDTPSLQA
ncbi:MAG TPA: SDR family NAD(P)-dependent oxidoreductase, partial [Saprospiraceae bacterium]|nr:SDR family NAD(P)-dependent oxidoreductase [Saprospiraceae bacterium]